MTITSKPHILLEWRIFLRLDSSSSCCAYTGVYNCQNKFIHSFNIGIFFLKTTFSYNTFELDCIKNVQCLLSLACDFVLIFVLSTKFYVVGHLDQGITNLMTKVGDRGSSWWHCGACGAEFKVSSNLRQCDLIDSY